METIKQKGKQEKKPTQCERLLNYIEKKGSISTIKAIIKLGIINPSARVQELKQSGVKIITNMKEGRNRYGERCRYAVYTIDKGGN